ncbi:hypothetical protein MsAc7_10620 [Methanolapillus millepedarum]|uniref:Uncharacterized protein n=1 Tax=Methanolapillus millepedarum TaxID=3028296 RepID=A0AA96V3Z0_9EURY|nr:hypothetical protein MsAc7_10620 [Methanosarcinaceae archaeon Ac7]
MNELFKNRRSFDDLVIKFIYLFSNLIDLLCLIDLKRFNQIQ